MPLLDEADRISYLATFQDLPLDLQALALRHLIQLARSSYAEAQRQIRIQRAWFEYELEDRPVGYRIIE